MLRRSGCKDEKICFILDESNVMDSGFLERMNTLLANGEVGLLPFPLLLLSPLPLPLPLQVPGLFEGDEHTTLMTQCKEGAQRQGLMLDTNEELYKWFTTQVTSSPSFSPPLPPCLLPSSPCTLYKWFTRSPTGGFLHINFFNS